MRLREFVETGPVGTRAQRIAFEHGLVEAHVRAIETGLTPPGTWAIDADTDPALWALAFQFIRDMGHA